MKAISSMAAATAGPAECRCAATPATSSTSFMITPPCTLPSRFVSSTLMIRLSVVRAAEVGFGSSAPSTPLFDHGNVPSGALGPALGTGETGQKLARPSPPLDLVCALVDLSDLRVSHHPLDRIVLHVAVAA